MDTAKVGIREFRAGLAEYIASRKPVAITRHGQTVGYFIPTQGEAVAELAALKKAAAELDRLLAARCRRGRGVVQGGSQGGRSGSAQDGRSFRRPPDHAMTRRSIDLSGFFQGYSAIPGLTGIVYPELLRSTIVPPGIVLLIAGVLVSLYPASRAAGLDPSRAIRHT